MMLDPGKRIGDYEILEKLGEGGFACVYRARQKYLGREVALKVLKPDLLVDQQTLARFAREAQTMSRLRHKNVVSVYSFGSRPDGQLYIVMEYFPGKGLNLLIPPLGLESNHVRSIFLQISDALEHVHDYGVIHRDLTPANCLVSGDGMAKLVDFGLARLVQGNGLALMKLSAAGLMLGTPAYASPEQCTGDRLDKRSDIYSLGCTVYHALLGVPPFRSDSAVAVMCSHLTSEPSFTRLDGSTLDPRLVECLSIALQKDPSRRYASAREFGDAFNSCFERESQSVLCSWSPRPKTNLRILKPAQSRTLLVFLVFTATLLLLLDFSQGSKPTWTPGGSLAANNSNKLLAEELRLCVDKKDLQALSLLLESQVSLNNPSSADLAAIFVQAADIPTTNDWSDLTEHPDVAAQIQKLIARFLDINPDKQVRESLLRVYARLLADKRLASALDLNVAFQQIESLGRLSSDHWVMARTQGQIALLLAGNGQSSQLAETSMQRSLATMRIAERRMQVRDMVLAAFCERRLALAGYKECDLGKAQHYIESGLAHSDIEKQVNWAMVEYARLVADSYSPGVANGKFDVDQYLRAYEHFRSNLWPQTLTVNSKALQLIATHGVKNPTNRAARLARDAKELSVHYDGRDNGSPAIDADAFRIE